MEWQRRDDDALWFGFPQERRTDMAALLVDAAVRRIEGQQRACPATHTPCLACGLPLYQMRVQICSRDAVNAPRGRSPGIRPFGKETARPVWSRLSSHSSNGVAGFGLPRAMMPPQPPANEWRLQLLNGFSVCVLGGA
jgi:hypothetical protein